MKDSRWARLAIWTGPLFTVAFLVIVLILEKDLPGEKSSGAHVVDYFNSHKGRTMTDVFLAPLLVTLLLVFTAELRSRAQTRGSRAALGPTVLMAGAVVWAAGALLGSALELATVIAADHHKTQAAETVNVIAAADWIPFIAGIAVFLLGAGITVLASRVLPDWLGWIAVAAGVVSLAGPGGFIGFFGAPAWILVAGIVLAVRAGGAPEPDAVQTPPARVGGAELAR